MNSQMVLTMGQEALLMLLMVSSPVLGVALVVGLLVLMSAVLPHYGRKIATTESFFVAAAHRSSGAGLALLREAKRAAADMWCAGIFASAPAGGRADELFAVMGLEPVSRIYFAAVE